MAFFDCFRLLSYSIVTCSSRTCQLGGCSMPNSPSSIDAKEPLVERRVRLLAERFIITILIGLAVCLFASASGPFFPSASEEQPATDLRAFSALAPIDAHAHVFKNDPAFAAMLERLNLRILDICVVDKHDRGFEEAAPQNQKAREILHSTHGRSAWCSTFDPQDFESPDFSSRSKELLNETFVQGAVAVKIYKNIGMELKKRGGSYLMPDDPVFNP